MFDYVIIGAGVYGAATAWKLAQAGARVCVVDEGDVAGRASGGPGRRGVRANGRDRAELPLMRIAYDVWPVLHEELGSEPFYQRTGQLLLVESETDFERARAQVWLQRQQGIECELLKSAALRELEPHVAEAMQGAIYCPLDGVADHGATTRAYAAAAKRLGVTFHLGTRVSAINVTAGRASGVTTADGRSIGVDQGVLVLTNGAVPELLASQLQLPIWNSCLQVLVSQPLASNVFSHLIGHLSRTVSLKPGDGNRVMISGGWHGLWDQETATGRTVDAAVRGNVAEAIAVFPGLRGLTVDVSDANHLESFSVDGIPIIDTVPGTPNLWYATGWCGHGWAIAPVITEQLADWVLTGKASNLLKPFSAQRFLSSPQSSAESSPESGPSSEHLASTDLAT